VRVRPGFARNYLIPRGLAVPATKGNLARIDELKRIALRHTQQKVDDAKALKQKLESVSVKIERAVGEEGKMYGSVTAKDIEDAYVAQGLRFDRKKLELADPIRQLGLSEVKIKVHADIVATLRVEVIKA
jgi:large subunit ribosomal protein L9